MSQTTFRYQKEALIPVIFFAKIIPYLLWTDFDNPVDGNKYSGT